MRGLVEGLRWTVAHPVLGPTTWTSTTRNLFWAARTAVLVVFLVGELGAAPWMVSGVLIAAAAGGLVGAQVAGRLIERQRVGSARLYWAMAAWTGPLYLVLPFAQPGWGLLPAAVSLFASAATVAASAVAVVPYKALVTPAGLRTRTYAAGKWLTSAAMAIGALLGGLSVTWFGFVPTLLVSGLGAWAAALWLVRIRLWRVRNFEDATGAGGAGGLFADGLSADVEARVHRVLVRHSSRRWLIRWAAGLLRIRGPPLPVGKADRLWTPSQAQLARWLRRRGMDRETAADVAGRVWAAAWDEQGHRTYVVVRERVPALRVSEKWTEVRGHEDRHLAESTAWAVQDHTADSARLIDEIEHRVRTRDLSAAGEVPGLRLPGRGHRRLRDLFEPVRTASAEVEQVRLQVLPVQRAIAATGRAEKASQRAATATRRAAEASSRLRRWWALRQVPADLRGVQNLPELLEERGLALLQAQRAEQRATSEAMADAVLAGFGYRDVRRAREIAAYGWWKYLVGRVGEAMAREEASVAGAASSLSGQVAGAQMQASMEFAAYYGQSDTWVTTQGSMGTAATAAISLSMVGVADRLMRNMAAVVVLGVIGASGMVVIGLVEVAVWFLPSLVAIGIMGAAAGLVRGRMAVYHPLPPEQKDVRDSRYETWATITQLVMPLLIVNGIHAVGIPAMMLVLAVLSLGLTVAVWAAVRGEYPGVRPPQPVSVKDSVVGMVLQVVGTPHGVARLLMSIPVLTTLTGMPPFVMGAAIVDQMVLLNDPTSVYDPTLVVSALLMISRLAALVVRMGWPRIKKVLGMRGAVGAALRLRRAEPEPMNEGRVLRTAVMLALVQLVPALWLFASPGLVPLFVLYAMSAAATAWTQAALPRWMEGGKGSSLLNVGRAGTVAAGAAVSVPVLGGFAAAVADRVAAGGPYADLVDAAHGRMVLLVVVLLPLTALVTLGVTRMRIGTLDELEAALVDVGIENGAQARDAEAAAADIKGKLGIHGVRDIGSASAIFGRPAGSTDVPAGGARLADEWRPVVAPRVRPRAREARRKGIDLTPGQEKLLHAALDRILGQR